MAKSWFVQPETVRIDLEDGQWIEVKKRLTAGEDRLRMTSVISEVRQDGRYTPDPTMVGKANVMAYLVDWSLRDNAGKKVAIEKDAQKLAAMDALSPEAFKVISDAINAHEDAMEAEREAEKKSMAGEVASSVT